MRPIASSRRRRGCGRAGPRGGRRCRRPAGRPPSPRCRACPRRLDRRVGHGLERGDGGIGKVVRHGHALEVQVAPQELRVDRARERGGTVKSLKGRARSRSGSGTPSSIAASKGMVARAARRGRGRRLPGRPVWTGRAEAGEVSRGAEHPLGPVRADGRLRVGGHLLGVVRVYARTERGPVSVPPTSTTGPRRRSRRARAGWRRRARLRRGRIGRAQVGRRRRRRQVGTS